MKKLTDKFIHYEAENQKKGNNIPYLLWKNKKDELVGELWNSWIVRNICAIATWKSDKIYEHGFWHYHLQLFKLLVDIIHLCCLGWIFLTASNFLVNTVIHWKALNKCTFISCQLQSQPLHFFLQTSVFLWIKTCNMKTKSAKMMVRFYIKYVWHFISRVLERIL